MAEQIATENGLLTLRVRVQPRGREIAAQLQLVSYIGGSAHELEEWWLDSATLDLPARLDAQWTPARTLPFEVSGGLRDAIWRLGLASHLPLWLHLVKPYGFLGAFDWEAALVPELGRSMLRLPDFLERPRESPDTLNVALVCSAPVSESPLYPPIVLRNVAAAIFAGSRRPRTTIHVFADDEYYEKLCSIFADEPRVDVHDPQEAQRHGVSRSTSGVLGLDAAEVRSPWLKWLRDSMKGRSLDAVHFVCHGYVSNQQPALALAESPLSNRDRFDARYVGVGELAAFLTQVGAWSAVFSSPPDNYSEAGLRFLADSVAQARPGPVLHHMLRPSGLAIELLEMYGFLYSPAPSQVPTHGDWFAYCQPSLVADLAMVNYVRTRRHELGVKINAKLIESLPQVPMKRIRQPAEEAEPMHADAPNWVSAAQRYVEQQTLQLQRGVRENSESDGRVAEEVERTLDKLQEIVGNLDQGAL